jgi:hypothetical protein
MPPYQLIVLLPPLASTPLWLEMLPSIISTLSIVTAAAVTIYVMIANRRQSILPSLVFYRTLIGQSYKWRIKNAGNGLAINIAVCNYSSDGHPVEQIGLYPIACNEEAQLDFITTGASKLVVSYENMYGKDSSHAECQGHKNTIHKRAYSQLKPTNDGHENRDNKWPVTRIR